MAIWFALLVAPILALADQSLALSMTAWACRGQHGLALHVVHVAFALVVAAATWLAWLRWRETAVGAAASETTARRRFLAGMAIGNSALSLLVIVTMWVPTWLLSSCLE
jgi:Na+/melibiose symporter-like transporter